MPDVCEDHVAVHFNYKPSELGDVSQRLIDSAELALTIIEEYLSFGDLNVSIKCNPQRTIPTYGLSGYANDDHDMTLWVDPSNPALVHSLETPLHRTLAHEVHHCMRQRTVGYGAFLEEALVMEGLADHFSLEVFPGQIEPWDRAFTSSEFKTWYDAAKQDFGDKDYDHTRWFFGSEALATPPWIGYSLGFQIVERYLGSHTENKPSQLFAIPASDIYAALDLA